MSAPTSPRKGHDENLNSENLLPAVHPLDENELAEHLASVQFIKPTVKIICSKHKGSILADDGPTVVFSREELEKTKSIYRDALAQVQAQVDALRNEALQPTGKGKGKEKEKEPVPVPDENVIEIKPVTHVSRDSLPKIMETYGFLYTHHDIFQLIVERLLGADVVELDEEMFCNFVQVYRAPAFYYGQRLRRYVSRGETADALELVVRGCDANTADGEGLTALHYACEFNHFEFIQKIHEICDEKLLLNPKDKYGWTPLHCACHHGNDKCVRALLDLGAEHSSLDVMGKTPLHFAAAQDREVICLALLDAGASASATDKHLMTPVHDAAYKGHSKVYRLLSKVPSADRQARDRLGYTAADYASILTAEGEVPPLPPPEDDNLSTSSQSVGGGGGGGGGKGANKDVHGGGVTAAAASALSAAAAAAAVPPPGAKKQSVPPPGKTKK